MFTHKAERIVAAFIDVGAIIMHGILRNDNYNSPLTTIKIPAEAHMKVCLLPLSPPFLKE